MSKEQILAYVHGKSGKEAKALLATMLTLLYSDSTTKERIETMDFVIKEDRK